MMPGPRRNLDSQCHLPSGNRYCRWPGICCSVSHFSFLTESEGSSRHGIASNGPHQNSKMRVRLKALHENIDSANLRLSSLASTVSTKNARVLSLDQALFNTSFMCARVDAMTADSAAVKLLVVRQLHEYQALKENIDNFSVWTRAVSDEMAPMQLLASDSREALRRTTAHIVYKLLEREQGDVKAICERLRQLSIAPA